MRHFILESVTSFEILGELFIEDSQLLNMSTSEKSNLITVFFKKMGTGFIYTEGKEPLNLVKGETLKVREKYSEDGLHIQIVKPIVGYYVKEEKK